jgi:tetratricopeptide (TPR) repeat protein
LLIPEFAEAARRYDLGRYDEAIEFAEMGIEKHPDNPGCYFILALNSARLRKKAQAREYLERAKTAKAKPEVYHFYSSVIATCFAEHRHAESEILAALDLNPNGAMYHCWYARILATKRRFGPAIEELDTALRLDPENAGALQYKTELLSQTGRREEAEEHNLLLLKLNPNAPAPHATAGLLHLKLGHADAALTAYREALRLDPNSKQARDGVLDALRSHFVLYRWFFAFNNWAESLPKWTASIPNFAVLALLLCDDYHAVPWMRLVVTACLVAVFAVTTLRLCGKHAANVLLIFHPLGRLLLNRNDKAEVVWFCWSLAVLICSAALLVRHPSHDRWGLLLTAVISCIAMGAQPMFSETPRTRWLAFGAFVLASLGCEAYFLARIL